MTLPEVLERLDHLNQIGVDLPERKSEKRLLIERLQTLTLGLLHPLIRRLMIGPMDIGDVRVLKTKVIDVLCDRRGSELNVDKLASDIGDTYTRVQRGKLSEEKLVELAGNLDAFYKNVR